MDNTSYRTNRQGAQEQSVSGSETSSSERSSSRSSKTKQVKGPAKLPVLAIIAIVVVLVVLVFGGWLLSRSNSGAGGNIDSNKLQAVFFTNGQVYFGRLHVVNSEYMKLTNIFYLQEKTASKDDNPQATSSNSNSANVQLVKLGQEVHGPEDAMVFSKDQVLFFENLKKDGNVSKTIASYQNK